MAHLGFIWVHLVVIHLGVIWESSGSHLGVIYLGIVWGSSGNHREGVVFCINRNMESIKLESVVRGSLGRPPKSYMQARLSSLASIQSLILPTLGGSAQPFPL